LGSPIPASTIFPATTSELLTTCPKVLSQKGLLGLNKTPRSVILPPL
jgi:hypothetical protein